MDVRAMSLFFALLTVGADVFVLVAVSLRLTRSTAWTRFRETFAPSALWFAWIVSVVATLGSLYLSEVAHFVPCTLCWYQRIGMYPLPLILGIAAYRRDFGIRRYVVPMAAVAAFISVYHYQLERLPDQGGPSFCSAAASCTFVWIWRFHFISIPFMALSAFALIITLLTLPAKKTAESLQAAAPDAEVAA